MALRVLFWPVMMDAVTDLGTRIRRAREAKRLKGRAWTQEYLASQLGVSTRTVGRWENGAAVPRGSIGALEQLLDVSLSEDVDPDEIEFYELLDRLRDNPLTEGIDLRPLEQAFEQRKRRGRHRAPRGASELAS